MKVSVNEVSARCAGCGEFLTEMRHDARFGRKVRVRGSATALWVEGKGLFHEGCGDAVPMKGIPPVVRWPFTVEGITPAMRRALTVKGMSTLVAWERGEVATQTMNRLDAAGLWVKTRAGGYRETKLGFDVTVALLKEQGS